MRIPSFKQFIVVFYAIITLAKIDNKNKERQN